MARIPRTLPDVLRQSPEVIVGRTAAACVHPIVAWRTWPRSWRLMALIAYAGASYATVLAVLVILNL